MLDLELNSTAEPQHKAKAVINVQRSASEGSQPLSPPSHYECLYYVIALKKPFLFPV